MKRPYFLSSNAVWPPALGLFIFGMTWVIFEGSLGIIRHRFGTGVDGDEIGNVRGAILDLAAVSFAVFRIVRFHPACSVQYSCWLKSSPWTAAKPLPLGPIHLVWQDGAMLAVLAVLAWYVNITPLIPVAAFVLIYSIGMSLVLAFTRTWTPFVVLMFLWPSLILPVLDIAGIAVVLILLCLALWWGHWASLKSFPWPMGHLQQSRPPPLGVPQPLLNSEIKFSGAKKDPVSQFQVYGWPHNWLSPKLVSPSISPKASIIVSSLVGWWIYCICCQIEEPVDPVFVLIFGIVCAFVRLGIYVNSISTPFNIWGRLATRRFIVPGFDKVFIAPLIILGLGMAGAIVTDQLNNLKLNPGAAVLGIILFASLQCGPSLRKWRLTGQHRYLVLPRIVVKVRN